MPSLQLCLHTHRVCGQDLEYLAVVRQHFSCVRPLPNDAGKATVRSRAGYRLLQERSRLFRELESSLQGSHYCYRGWSIRYSRSVRILTLLSRDIVLFWRRSQTIVPYGRSYSETNTMFDCAHVRTTSSNFA